MKFVNLKDKPEYIRTVAEWFYKEWSHLNPTRSLDDVVQLIRGTLTKDTEQIFICLSKNTLVSSVSFRAYELQHKEKYTPWLSSLVVDKTKRRRGIGAKTINFLLITVSQIALKKSIYLRKT